MKLKLETPPMVMKAREAQKGKNWFLELLIFGVVLVAASFAESIVMIPIIFAVLLTNQNFLTATLSGNTQVLNEVVYGASGSDGITLGMLFANLAMTGVVMLLCKVMQKRKMDTLGFVKKDMGKEYLRGLGLGFLMFSAAVLLCVITGSLQIEGISSGFAPGIFLLFVLGFLIQGMAEEVLCRGYFLVSFGRRHSMWAAVLVNSVLFAALHLGNSGVSPLAILNLTLFGVFASVYFIKRGSIWGIGALHSIWNLAQGNVYGVRVSGIVTNCSLFVSTPVERRGMINGGTFGLEGGAAVTVVLLAGILLLLRSRSVYENPAGIEEAELLS